MVHPTGAQLAARKAAAPWISGRYWGCYAAVHLGVADGVHRQRSGSLFTNSCWRSDLAQRFERLELQRTGAPPIAFFVSTPSG